MQAGLCTRLEGEELGPMNLTYKRSDVGGPRHYLGDEPVSCGAALDLLTPLGWLSGRFELAWTREPDGELVEDGKVPMFHTSMPIEENGAYLGGSRASSMAFRLTGRHVLRWPRDEISSPNIAVWGYCRECDGRVPPGARVCAECS